MVHEILLKWWVRPSNLDGALNCVRQDLIFFAKSFFLIRLVTGNSGARSFSSNLGLERQVHLLPRNEAQIPARARGRH